MPKHRIHYIDETNSDIDPALENTITSLGKRGERHYLLSEEQACQFFGLEQWIHHIEDKSGKPLPDSEFIGIVESHTAICKVKGGIGYALKAVKEIKKGQEITSYAGQLKDFKKGGDSYAAQYQANDPNNLVTPQSKGNESRFIQGSLGAADFKGTIKFKENKDYTFINIAVANAQMKNNPGGSVKKIIALSDIKPGEIIVMDYGHNYWAQTQEKYRVLTKMGAAVPEDAYQVIRPIVLMTKQIKPKKKKAKPQEELIVCKIELNKLQELVQTYSSIGFGPQSEVDVPSEKVAVALKQYHNQIYIRLGTIDSAPVPKSQPLTITPPQNEVKNLPFLRSLFEKEMLKQGIDINKLQGESTLPADVGENNTMQGFILTRLLLENKNTDIIERLEQEQKRQKQLQSCQENLQRISQATKILKDYSEKLSKEIKAIDSLKGELQESNEQSSLITHSLKLEQGIKELQTTQQLFEKALAAQIKIASDASLSTSSSSTSTSSSSMTPKFNLS